MVDEENLRQESRKRRKVVKRLALAQGWNMEDGGQLRLAATRGFQKGLTFLRLVRLCHPT